MAQCIRLAGHMHHFPNHCHERTSGMSDSHSIEIWKQIPGYGLHYEASSLGRIRVKDRTIIKNHSRTGHPTKYKYKSKVLSPSKNDKWGHTSVTLGVDGTDYGVSVHQLVLLAFHGERPDGMEACHNNGIASDNGPSNLRWDTHLANNRDRLNHGTYKRGEDHQMSKLSNSDADEIRNSFENVDLLSKKYQVSKSAIQRIKYGKAENKVENYEAKVSNSRHVAGVAKLKGVSWDKHAQRWKASISIGGGKSKHIGRFDTEEKAHEAWLDAHIKTISELFSTGRIRPV